jgi:anti-sigma factor RsiW
MTSHLDSATLNGLVDGELSAEQLSAAGEHLAGCAACTSSALHQSLLKSATARAGQRHALPRHLQERLTRLAAQDESQAESLGAVAGRRFQEKSTLRSGWMAWATAALLLVALATVALVERNTRRREIASTEKAALVTESFDRHLATLAVGLPPQVLSSDRHTVKPWFQGKIPFSFNLPEKLPEDTTLDGANLAYLDNQPVAQLLYSIGRHRVSVFVLQSRGAAEENESLSEHSGFHVMRFNAEHLAGVAVSDVDPPRLAELVNAIRQAQTVAQNPAR